LNRKEPVETEIPWPLHIQIIKLQGKLESSYMEACIEAAKLIDANGPERAPVHNHRLNILNLQSQRQNPKKLFSLQSF
jgi:hypothetical protein